MVREGREFEVVDAKSGEDITRQVLTQIIVDEEARGSTMLPINFLKQLIGLYGNSMQTFVPSYLEAAMEAFQRNQSAAKDAFGGNVFADLAKRNMAMLEDAAQVFTGKKTDTEVGAQRRRSIEGRACGTPGQSRSPEPLKAMRFEDCCGARAGAPSSLVAQTAIPDLGTALPLAGDWTYAAMAGGSQATLPTLGQSAAVGTVHAHDAPSDHRQARDCRGAFPDVWTSSLTRSVPASFNPATKRLTIDLGAYDPLLDAIASSRGRVGFAVGTQPALVVPPWAEASRVIEDCRV